MFHQGGFSIIKSKIKKIWGHPYLKGPLAALIVVAFAFNWLKMDALEKESLQKFKQLLGNQVTPISYYKVDSLFDTEVEKSGNVLSAAEATCLMDLSNSGSTRPPAKKASKYGYIVLELGSDLVFLETRQKEDTLFVYPWVKNKTHFEAYGFSGLGNCSVDFGANET